MTIIEMLNEAQRELAMRRRLYPQWSATASPAKKKQFDHQLRCQEAIVAKLIELNDVERRMPDKNDLFGGRAL